MAAATEGGRQHVNLLQSMGKNNRTFCSMNVKLHSKAPAALLSNKPFIPTSNGYSSTKRITAAVNQVILL
jgi:hypothetical protein